MAAIQECLVDTHSLACIKDGIASISATQSLKTTSWVAHEAMNTTKNCAINHTCIVLHSRQQVHVDKVLEGFRSLTILDSKVSVDVLIKRHTDIDGISILPKNRIIIALTTTFELIRTTSVNYITEVTDFVFEVTMDQTSGYHILFKNGKSHVSPNFRNHRIVVVHVERYDSVSKIKFIHCFVLQKELLLFVILKHMSIKTL